MSSTRILNGLFRGYQFFKSFGTFGKLSTKAFAQIGLHVVAATVVPDDQVGSPSMASYWRLVLKVFILKQRSSFELYRS